MNRAAFIVVEGPDGSGKSELTKKLVQHYSAVPCRDPGVGAVGVGVRDLIKNPYWQDRDPIAEILIFYCARMEASQKLVLKETRENGRPVISDRWSLSTKIYQAYQAKENDLLERRQLMCYLDRFIAEPDFTILLTADEGSLKERLEKRDDGFEHYGKRRAFLLKEYREWARAYSANILHIETSGMSSESVFQLAMRELEKRFGKELKILNENRHEI